MPPAIAEPSTSVPAAPRGIASALFRRAFIPASLRLVGSRRLRRLSELRRSATLTGAERAAFIDRQVRQLVRHAYENVPYYRRVWDKAGVSPEKVRGRADLATLPVLTKDDVVAHREDLWSRDGPRARLQSRRTSGSASVPMEYLVGPRHRDTLHALELRCMEETGWRIGQRWMMVRRPANPHDPPHWRFAAWLLPQRGRLVTAAETPAGVAASLARLRRFRPVLLVGATQRLVELAEAGHGDGAGPFVPAIQTHGSQLGAQRRVLEDAFGGRVRDRYGCLEAGVLALECPLQEGHHVQDDVNLTEVARAGDPVSAGEDGDLLVTALSNLEFPLIRYEVGDAGRMAVDACACGRPTSRLARLEGRTLERIPLPSGGHTYAHFIYLFQKEPLVRHSQVVLEGDRDITLRIVPRAGFGAHDEERIRRAVLDVDPLFRVRIDRVERIEPGAGGKPLHFVRRAPR